MSPALLMAVWQQVISALTGCSVRQVVSHGMRAGFRCRLTSAISYVLPPKSQQVLDVGVQQPCHIQSEALGRQDGVGQSVDPIECLVGIMFR